MKEQLHNQTDSQGRKQGYWEETDKYDLIWKGHYVDGLREGLWQTYFSNGILWKEEHYLNGKRHGLWKMYRRDGTLQEEVHYLNGDLHGLWKWYHKDGTLESCSLYNMDEVLSTSPLLFLLPWLNLL
jgi:antitoxin component YwqK of YwqJK toxin-antitoxin module